MGINLNLRKIRVRQPGGSSGKELAAQGYGPEFGFPR